MGAFFSKFPYQNHNAQWFRFSVHDQGPTVPLRRYGAPVSAFIQRGASPSRCTLQPVIDRNCVFVSRVESNREVNDKSVGLRTRSAFLDVKATLPPFLCINKIYVLLENDSSDGLNIWFVSAGEPYMHVLHWDFSALFCCPPCLRFRRVHYVEYWHVCQNIFIQEK